MRRARRPWQQLGRIAWLALVVSLGLGFVLLPLLEAAALATVVVLAVVCLLRPAVGLALLALAVPFGEVVPWPHVALGPLDVGLGEVLVGLVVLGWLGGALAGREPANIGPLVWPMAAYLGALLLSAAFAPHLDASVKELARWLEVIVVYLAATNLARSDRARGLLLGSILAAGAGQALVGAYQFFAVVGPEAYQVDGFLRAFGTFGQPNPFAGYLEMVVPLGLALVFVWWPGRGSWLWWLALASALLGGAAIVMSLSRGAWLGMAVGVVVAAAVATRRFPLVAAGGAAIAALGFVADRLSLLPSTVSERLLQVTEDFRPFEVRGVKPTDANFAVLERMAHWQAGWEMFRDHPLVGVGPGHYAISYLNYAVLPYWTEALGHAHNIYINVAAETGLIGLVAYLVMLASWFALVLSRARKLLTTEPTGLSRAVVVGVLGCLVAVSVHNVFDNLYVHMLNVQIALLLGLAGAAFGREVVRKPETLPTSEQLEQSV